MKDNDTIRDQITQANRQSRLSGDDPQIHSRIQQLQVRLKEMILQNPEQVIQAHSKIFKK